MKKILIFASIMLCLAGCKNNKSQQNQAAQETNQTEVSTTEDIDLSKDDATPDDSNADDEKICQSCAMPMSEDLYGTNADGSKNAEYCKYCYANGKFTAPNITMAEMTEICVKNIVKEGLMSEVDARKLMNDALPKLKRWKTKK